MQVKHIDKFYPIVVLSAETTHTPVYFGIPGLKLPGN
jgi:hypothetical protein